MARNVPNKTLSLLPLGIPTVVISEDPQLIAAAAAAYAHWSTDEAISGPRVELRLEVGGASSEDVCLDIAVEGSRLRLRGRGVEGKADALTRKAGAVVTPDVVKDAAALTDVVDTLLLFVLARSGRTPVHASAFMVGDLAVALAGPSGSGKSTLTLAAADRGLPLLSDDMVFVQLDPAFALWGFPRPIHVFPEDAPPGDHPTRLRNSKLKAAVPMAKFALRADRTALVLLERGSKVDLQPIQAVEAVDTLMKLDAGFDLLERESKAALEAFASGGAWRLTLGDDPAAAIDLLVSRLAA